MNIPTSILRTDVRIDKPTIAQSIVMLHILSTNCNPFEKPGILASIACLERIMNKGA